MEYNMSGIAGFLGLRKSRARRALFALFFANPGQEYFPRQLERMTGVLVGNLQRELIHMERAELLSTRRLGKLKLYKLNQRHPLYPEIKGLVTKTVGLEELIRSGLAAIEGTRFACIYGSFAKNQERAESDVDILVVGRANEKFIIQAIRHLEKMLQREINYTFYTPEDWKKRKAARDSFVTELLKQPRITLIGNTNAI